MGAHAVNVGSGAGSGGLAAPSPEMLGSELWLKMIARISHIQICHTHAFSLELRVMVGTVEVHCLLKRMLSLHNTLSWGCRQTCA